MPRFTLRPHQRIATDWLLSRGRSAILADAPRVGKTGEALIAAYEKDPGCNHRVLVLGPVAARSVWQDGVESWLPGSRWRATTARTFDWPRHGEVVFSTYEGFPRLFQTPIPHKLTLILDEAHKIRNPMAALSTRILALCRAVLESHHLASIWALTATPIMNYPPELWTLLEALQLERETWPGYSDFVRAFNGLTRSVRGRDVFGLPITRVSATDWGRPSPDVPTILRKVMLRRTYAQVSQHLPRRTFTDWKVDLSDDARRLSDEALLAIHRRGMSISEAFRYANLRDCMRFEEVSRAKAAVAACKLPALMGLVENFEANLEPLVVGSDHRSVTDALDARPGWHAITGDTSPKRRRDIVQDFQAGMLKGVVLSARAASVAVDLTRARTMVVTDHPWSPGEFEQLTARIEGPNQSQPTEVITLSSEHPFEKRLKSLVAMKGSIIMESTGKV